MSFHAPALSALRSTLTSSWWFCWRCWWPAPSSCQLALQMTAAAAGRCVNVCSCDWLFVLPPSDAFSPLFLFLPQFSPLSISWSLDHVTDLRWSNLHSSPLDSSKHILWVETLGLLHRVIYFPSTCLVWNNWQMFLPGNRSNCGNLCCIWRHHSTQHGRLAAWSLLVSHIFLDPRGCRFFSPHDMSDR